MFQRHDIPISAIPCLAYRKALEEEDKQKEIDRSIAEQISNGTWASDQPNGEGKDTIASDNPEKDQQANESAKSNQTDLTTIETTDLSKPISESMEVANIEPSDSSNKTCPFNKDYARKPVVLPGGMVMPPPRVETVNTSWKTQHLTSEQMNDYCKKLFKFKNVNIMHFK